MREGVVVLPMQAVGAAAAAVALVVVSALIVLQPGLRDALVRAIDPRTVADESVLLQQRAATERAIQRGYLKAAGQLSEVRKLTLAISATQAATIDEKARLDLRTIRHDALGAVGARLGLAPPQLDAYVTNAEAQLGENAVPDERPVLLAPDLYAVVARANDLLQQSADAATRELTRAPSAPPTPAPTPSPSPRPSGSGAPSPSPTGR
jgi:hypothetical protein